MATKTLMDLGYKNVVNMSGGLVKWKEAGYPVETEKKAENGKK